MKTEEDEAFEQLEADIKRRKMMMMTPKFTHHCGRV